MVATVRAIFEQRRTENAVQFAPYGGDHGNVFPSLSRDGKRVQPVAEAKERRTARDPHGRVMRDEEGRPIRVTLLPGIQASRRTSNSVAMEVGVPQEIRESLMNHSGKGVNVKHYGRPQNWDTLRAAAEQVEAALWSRIRGEMSARKRR